MALSPDEQAAILEARSRGYYVRSGRTIRALRAWLAWCRANSRPTIVVAIGARQATIEVDGVKRWTGPAAGAEDQAAAVVQEATTKRSAVPI